MINLNRVKDSVFQTKFYCSYSQEALWYFGWKGSSGHRRDSWIWASCARSLLQEGCRVIISSRNAENVASSLEELDAPGQVVAANVMFRPWASARIENLALSSFGQMDIGWIMLVSPALWANHGRRTWYFYVCLNTNIVGFTMDRL